MGQITISGSTVDEVINLAMSMKNASAAVAKTETSAAKVPSAAPAAPAAKVPSAAPAAPAAKVPSAAPSRGVPAPAPRTAPAAPVGKKKKADGIDVEDVRALQTDIVKRGGSAFIKETLGVFGVAKLTELDPELMEEYHAALVAYDADTEEDFG